ncbi:MAG: KH domain-containing protein [Cyanobacteriota bacterium]|nr:KH domain-containing protein [Cyanobacteriota bacterium]
MPNPTATPDYEGLVKFLLAPFLESPESLSVDCEQSSSRPKILIRVAFEAPDKGRVFGRGGRNISAIRTSLEAIGQTVGQSVHLDIYGSTGNGQGSSEHSDQVDRSSRRRTSKPKVRRPNSRQRDSE